MRNVLTIAAKDLRLLVRDKLTLFWAVLFPLVYALFFGSVMGGAGSTGGSGGPPAMRIAVVDLDQTPESRALVQRLNDSGALRTQETISRDGAEAPMDLESARDLVATGRRAGYIVIPEGYGAGATPWSQEEKPEIELGVDPSRQAEVGILQGLVMEAIYKGLQDLFTSTASMQDAMADARTSVTEAGDLSPAQKALLTTLFNSVDALYTQMDADESFAAGADIAFEPATVTVEPVTRVEGRRPRGFEVSFPQAVSWALIGCASGFAMTLVHERTQGTFMRLLLAPQRVSSVLAGKALACFLACAVIASLLLVLGAVAFNVRIASAPALIVGVLAMSVCFVGLMMFICTLGRTEGAVAGASWGILLFAAMLGGGMIPLVFLPGWMQTLAVISPVRWTILAMEGAIWRGLTMVELAPAWAVLFAIGAAGFFAGVLMLRRQTN